MIADTDDSGELDTMRDKPSFWLRWIKASKKAAAQQWRDAKTAYDEYENKPAADSSTQLVQPNRQDTGRCYPIYFSSCKTFEPALYARTPKITTDRAFEDYDPIAQTMCLIIERAGRYLVRGFDFDGVMSAAVQDLIHAGKSCLQLIYDKELKTEKVRQPLNAQTNQETGELEFSIDGQIYDGEVLQDEKGYFYEQEQETLDSQKIQLAPALYCEVLHTPEAKLEFEIKDKAYYFCIEYEEAIDWIGKEKADSLPWKAAPTANKEEGESENRNLPGKIIEGWECWCKATRRVYWVCEDYPQDFVKVEQDPYGLAGFFPSTPFQIQSKPSKTMYPTPVFAQLAPTAEQLHVLYAKTFALIRAIRRRAIVDGQYSGIITALQDLGDNEFVPVDNLQSIIEKGGIQDLIQYVPVQELVEAITELVQLEDRFKNNFSEWFGVPDILRGVSDPIETAAAQEIKSDAAHDRFKYLKKQVQEVAKDGIQMMLDLALKEFDDQKWAQIAGYPYMKPEDQQRFALALANLRSDTSGAIRVAIETDSLTFKDEARESQKRAAIASTVTQGLQQIAQMSQTNPSFTTPALRVIRYAVNGMAEGKEFSDDVTNAIQPLIDAAENPPEPPPPPPDYEAQKVEIERIKVEGDLNLKSQELELKREELSLKGEKELAAISLKNTEIQLKTEVEQIKTALNQTKENFSQFIQQQTLDLEKASMIAIQQEKLADNERLKLDQELQIIKMAATQAPAPQQSQKPVVINLKGDNMKMGGSKRKRVRMIRTEDGQLIGESEEIDDE